MIFLQPPHVILRNLILTLLFATLMTSCSKNDEETDDAGGGNNVSSSFHLDIEGLENMDYEDYSVLSTVNSTVINDQGVFDDISDSSNEVELPLLFEHNEEVLFGLYPKTAEDGVFSVDDILVYFFSLHPEVSVQGYNISSISAKIPSLSKRKELANHLMTSLNQNQNPINNSGFTELYNTSATELVSLITGGDNTRNQVKNGDLNKDYIEDFQIDYKRDGNIIIPTEIPLFSAVAFEIKNKETNEFVAENYIMKSKAISMDLGSGFNYMWQKIFPESAPPEFKDFKLSEDGTYEIRFTNGGAGDDVLSETAKDVNRQYFITTIFSIAAPKILESVIKKIPGCLGEITAPKAGLAIQFAALYNNSPTDDDYRAMTINFLVDLTSAISKCLIENQIDEAYKTYTEKFLSSFPNILEKAATTSNLIFFTRDYFGSDINGSEIRYYSNGVSFGSLDLTNQTGYEFVGQEGDEFIYEATITEETNSYEVHRNLTYSEFKPKKTKEDANQLPFKIELISGDAVIDSEEEISHDGTLFSLLTMGKEDSEVKISPNFSTSDISPENIKLMHPSSDYQLEIGYYSKYTNAEKVVEFMQSLEDGDDITLTYGVFYAMRLLLNGEPVSNLNDNGWEYLPSSQYDLDTSNHEDVILNDYMIAITDEVNNQDVNFKLNITRDRSAHRNHLINKSLKFTVHRDGYPPDFIYDVVINDDYTVNVSRDGYSFDTTWRYDSSLTRFYSFGIECSPSQGKEIVAKIAIGSTGYTQPDFKDHRISNDLTVLVDGTILADHDCFNDPFFSYWTKIE